MEKKKLPKIVVLVGPTASGKSALGVHLAKKFKGEIVSADSRQVYKGMDVGTGKVTKKEMAGIRHHLLDVVRPNEQFTVVDYKELALKAIRGILKRKKLPILVGGTGLYIQAVVDNISFPEVPPDPDLRKKLEGKTTAELFGMLKLFDPGRAKTIDSHNRRRLVRALEIALKTRKPILPLKKQNPLFRPLIIGIKLEKPELKKLIKKRLQARLKKGLVKEVKKLHQQGVSFARLENFGLEYRYVSRYLTKKLSLQEMLRQLEKAIIDYARRQETWFKKDKRIHWVQTKKEAEKLVREFL